MVTENHIFSTDITTVIPPQYKGVRAREREREREREIVD